MSRGLLNELRLELWEAFVSAQKTTRRHGDDDLNLVLEFLLVVVSSTPELAVQPILRDQPKALFFDLDFQAANSFIEALAERPFELRS